MNIDQFASLARDTFSPDGRCACTVCGQYKSLSQAHHIVPISMQFFRGFEFPQHDYVWLCPTHHVAVHIVIGQMKSTKTKASAACIGVVCDLSSEGLDILRKVVDLAGRAWQ